jgi:hypothetical protein
MSGVVGRGMMPGEPADHERGQRGNGQPGQRQAAPGPWPVLAGTVLALPALAEDVRHGTRFPTLAVLIRP